MPAPDAAQAKMKSLAVDSTTRGKAKRTLNEWRSKDPSFEVTEEKIKSRAALHALIPPSEKVTRGMMDNVKTR
eukprot:1148532-Pyramimonas_sp.AAC.1